MAVHEHFGQNDLRLRQALDYDDSVAPTDGQAMLWVSASGGFVPRSVVLPSQRGPLGGVSASTLTTQTYALDATGPSVRRWTLTGNPTLSVPTNGVDGQRVVLWLSASGATRTFTFASGYEVSPVVPSRTLSIASGTWEKIEIECRNGTWRLVDPDQLLFGPADIGAAGAASVTQLRATTSQTCSAANTWYSVAFAAEDFDDENAHDNATNNTRWTASRACVVKVGASIVWVGSQSVTNPQRLMQFTRSGVIVPGSPGNAAYVATGLTQVIQPMLVSLSAGQYLELQMRSAAAGAQIYADSSTCSIMTIEIVR